jgi:hypothetical protein
MYLNVIPSPSPNPSVRGLGQARRERARVIPIPIGRGFGGLGQAPSTCAEYLAGVLAGFPAPQEVLQLLPESLGIIYITPGITSPSAAAQIVYQLAQSVCTVAGYQTTFGGSTPTDCANGGQAAAAAAYPNFLAYYNSLPAGVWTAAASGGSTSAVTQAQNAAQAPATVLTTPASATTATLENLSSPGDGFIVGDQFQLTITGSPNSTVTEVSSTQNGSSMGGYSPGSTDASGSLVITGTFGQSDLGYWTETWQVGSGPTATINFSIIPAAVLEGTSGGSNTPTGSGSSSGGSGSGSSGGSSGSSSGGGSQQTIGSSASSLPSWLTADIVGIPVWGWAAGAVVLLMIIPRGK